MTIAFLLMLLKSLIISFCCTLPHTGYSRRKHREPCRRVISFHLGLRVDRIYEHRIVWDNKLIDRNSEPYGQLSYESVRAVSHVAGNSCDPSQLSLFLLQLDSAMSMTPYSDEFMEAKVNNIYRGDPNLGGSGVYVNLTLKVSDRAMRETETNESSSLPLPAG